MPKLNSYDSLTHISKKKNDEHILTACINKMYKNLGQQQYMMQF